MTRSTSSSKARKTFLILFIVSTILALILLYIFSRATFPVSPESPGHPSPTPPSIEIGGLIAGLASCLTSIVSFFGLAATVFFGWRKDAREGKVSELERKRLEMELEKQKMEVSRLKAGEKQ
jgi:hypothetical protein